ncbi:MAG TPA: hypothetical protein VFR24_05305 [Candidatus Angelobacter sp.]|nr:hypothetical protein [Candidatus Angelobacter sp.]
MAVGLPSFFPESLSENDSAITEHQAIKPIPSKSARLSEEDLKALRQFLLLLDKWDRQNKIA